MRQLKVSNRLSIEADVCQISYYSLFEELINTVDVGILLYVETSDLSLMSLEVFCIPVSNFLCDGTGRQ